MACLRSSQYVHVIRPITIATTIPQPQTSWARLYEPSLTMLLHLNSSHANIMQIQIRSNRSSLYFLKRINIVKAKPILESIGRTVKETYRQPIGIAYIDPSLPLHPSVTKFAST